MRWSILLILVLQAEVDAADFRTLNIGDACEGVAEREAALGSAPIQWGAADQPGVHAFKSAVYGRDVSVVYLCTEGSLRIGSYFFPHEERSDALKTLREAYDALVSTYGRPFSDTTPWQHGAGEIDPRFVADAPQRYYASWRTPTLHPWIALRLHGGEQGPNWHVVVVFPGAPVAKRSNKALQP